MPSQKMRLLAGSSILAVSNFIKATSMISVRLANFASLGHPAKHRAGNEHAACRYELRDGADWRGKSDNRDEEAKERH